MKIILKTAAAIAAIILISMAGFLTDARIRIAGEETVLADEAAPGRFVTIDGHKLHVATIGDVAADPSGAPLVLLHGASIQGHAAWLPWASRLTGTRSLILPDLAGFGHSARIPAPGPHYTVKGRAASVAAVLDALEVAQVDIVGNGLGGTVAAQFALDYPARVRRIIFMDAAIYTQSGTMQTGTMQTGVVWLDDAITWHTHTGGPRSEMAQACKTQPSCRRMRLARVQGSTAALRAMMQTSDDSLAQLAQDISAIKTPTLVIWGGNDEVQPVADGDRLARDLKTTLAIIAEAGNTPYLQQPDKVAQRVLDFLKKPAP